MIALSVVLALLGGAGWLAGWWLLGRPKVERPPEEPDEPSGPPAAPSRRLSLIVPARNEATNLPRLLSSMSSAGPGMETLVVDDASTDDTAAVARACGACVLDAPPLPPGWRGKAWACHNGAAAAQGEWLLFLDADTSFVHNGLPRLLRVFEAGKGALSVLPWHHVERPYEQLSAFFNLVLAAATGGFPATPGRSRPMLVGPCLLIGRAEYDRIGGHAAVRNQTLEHLEMTPRLAAAGIPTRLLGGRELLHVRMYPGGWRELIDGWSKAFVKGAARIPRCRVTAIGLWLTGAWLAWLPLLLLRLPPLRTMSPAIPVTLYGLYAAQLMLLLRRVGSFHPLTGLLFPIPLAFYVGLCLRSALRRSGTWKGRRLDLDPPHDAPDRDIPETP